MSGKRRIRLASDVATTPEPTITTRDFWKLIAPQRQRDQAPAHRDQDDGGSGHKQDLRPTDFRPAGDPVKGSRNGQRQYRTQSQRMPARPDVEERARAEAAAVPAVQAVGGQGDDVHHDIWELIDQAGPEERPLLAPQGLAGR